MTIFGEDTSHFQGTPNWAQSVAAGRPFCVLKATEGTTFVDPTLTTNRNNAHAAGKIVGLYHFARAGNAAAEAQFFVKTISPIRSREFLVLDQEVPNTVAWCQQWLDTVYAATGVRPLIYMNQSASTGLALGDWSEVAKNYGLWLAKYDGTTAFPSVPYWGVPAMKQYSDRGTVPGIAGTCDVDVFNGSADQLLAYCKGGTSPVEDDLPLNDDDKKFIRDQVLDIVQKEGVSGAGDAPLMLTRGYQAALDSAVAKVTAAVSGATAPEVDEAKLAAALLADPKNVDALGAAIAAHLKLSSD